MKHLFSSIEMLEPRIAPAALTAKLAGGVLKIVGDPVAANVTILQTGGSIEVFDGATSLGAFAGVKSIGASMTGGGSFNLNLTGSGLPGPCKVTVTGLTAVNVVTNSHLDGGLSVSGDVAAQTLNVGDNVTIGKGLTFKGGDGVDTFTVGNGGTIGGNLLLAGVEAGSFNAASTGTSIAGKLTVLNAGDLLPTNIQTNTSMKLSIGGGVSVVGGKANDTLFISATITKSVTFKDTLGDNGLGLGQGSVVHGSVTMTTGVGGDGFNIQGGTVDGNLTLKLGGGNNTFFYGIAAAVTISGNLSFTGGSGDDKWQSSGAGMTVGKNVTMKLGDGANTIAVGVNISGTKLSVLTGSGVDTASIEGTGTSVAAIIALGAGNDLLQGSLLATVKAASFDGGAGTDHFAQSTLVADPIVIRSFEDFS